MKNRKGKAVKENPVPQKKIEFPKPALLWPVITALIAFALYANTITHDYVLDDSGAITNNLFVQKGIQGIPELLTVDLWHFDNVNLGYYRPLSLVTFALEYELFGANPHVSHFNNVVLFALTGFVLCLLLFKLFPKLHPAFPFLVALLYAA